ncbi:replication protein A 70 kDa DNA-binding subunit D-like [Helianthus annuus]|uniref:replication protein A 70 kDa DNA-binding subunit D-like n=1 Tax=Helianthus annuus TaxID=4232 RepID=UPI001652D1DF|nr:replication protein A 70 kDa DNA-binding subunit D-like [Helianthus annuus]
MVDDNRDDGGGGGGGYGYEYGDCGNNVKYCIHLFEMEQAAITLLTNVDLNVDDYTIRIRIGTKMQKVKYVHSSLKINLNDNTTVEACNEHVGAEWGFDFSPFDSVVDDPDDDGKSFKSPIDVIGFVIKCLLAEDKSEHNNGKDENKTTFILEDLRHPQIYVTLWGGYADQILEFEKNHKDEKNVVVVVQFGKYRFCGGNLFVSNLYTVTRVFINTEVKEILDFKKKFLTASTSSGYSGLSSSAMKSTTDEYLSDFSFSTIGALSEISQQKFVIILGTIKSFALEDSWFYNACKSCNKKVLTNTICKDKQDRTEGYDEVTILECQTDRCNKRTVVSVPRIKVLIRVQDCTGIVTLTLFEREVVKLIKVNANQLLDKNIEPADDEPLNVVPSDSNPTINIRVKDSVSRTGDEDTPMSNLNNNMFTTPSGPDNSCSVKMLENELKRNLDAVYDVDLCSSQSSTKPRKSYGENDEDSNVNVGLLKPKLEK